MVRLFQNRREVLRSHVGFFASFLMGLAAICTVYYLKKGDFLWQFKSELLYYQAQKPDWYLAGRIDYKSLMWQYPRSLFGRSGYDSFQYREHGFLFWVFLPASIWGWTRTRSAPVRFFVASTFLIFAFFEFYPNYLVPYYLPLVRQERYLEMLLPGAVIIVGLALHQLSRKHRAVAVVILCLMISDFVAEARWRSIQYEDSQRDVRELARYAASTVLASKKPLVLDVPARNSLVFYLRDKAVPLEPVGAQPLSELRDCYIVVGGARSFWWSPGLVFDLQGERIPANWILAYQLPGTRRPWRASNLRVYYATSTSRR
jgi:hypothetical protein